MESDGNVEASAPPELGQILRRLRKEEFPWTAETTYLNNASIGPLPERTRRVLDAFNARRAAPHLLSHQELGAVTSEARAAAARLINADAAEIGVDVELAPVSVEGWPSEGYLLERLKDPRVRVLAISFVQFSNGYRADLDLLGAACRENGTYLVVDAIQGLGQLPLDVKRTPIDMLAAGGQKWLLSPWGSGILYVRRGLVQELRPALAGWLSYEGVDDFSHLTDYNTTLRKDARRFELSTPPFQEMAAMTESINLLMELGVDRIANYLIHVRRPLLEAAERGEFEIMSPTGCGHDSSIVCVRTEHVAESYHALKQAGVVGALREGSIRLSPHCYNTVEEMERVVDILRGG